MWDLLEPLAGFHHIKFDASKDGGKWAFVNMVTKEAAEYVIKELNGYEMKGREIEVKWAEEGMWRCADPSCTKKNFEGIDICIQCKLPRNKLN